MCGIQRDRVGMKWEGQSRNRQTPPISDRYFSLDLPSDPKVSWFYVKMQANCRQGGPEAEPICRVRKFPSGFIQTHFRPRKIPVPSSASNLSVPPSHFLPARSCVIQKMEPSAAPEVG